MADCQRARSRLGSRSRDGPRVRDRLNCRESLRTLSASEMFDDSPPYASRSADGWRCAATAKALVAIAPARLLCKWHNPGCAVCSASQRCYNRPTRRKLFVRTPSLRTSGAFAVVWPCCDMLRLLTRHKRVHVCLSTFAWCFRKVLQQGALVAAVASHYSCELAHSA